jgi:ABC-type oligopeptide transport system ATPase subunit
MSALLELDGVTKTFSTGGLLDRTKVRAVKGVSFALDDAAPEVFTIVGESGSGKTTIARMVLGNETPTTGTIRFMGEDLARLRSRAQRLRFMARVQPIFQNPFEAFNPLTRIDYFLSATAKRFLGVSGRAAVERAVDEALQHVGLSLAEVRGRYSHELSGGQLQRIAVARALIPGPKLIVADEPVSMVDASLRVSIVNLFRTLRDELAVSIIYITHDLATAYYISDRVIIMNKGDVVEAGDARAVLDNPTHDYSIALRNAVLPPDPALARAAIARRRSA